MKRITINVPPEIHTKFKTIASEQGTTMTDILVEYVYKVIREYEEKKKEAKIKTDFLSFTKHIWPEFIEGYHHKIIAKKFNEMA